LNYSTIVGTATLTNIGSSPLDIMGNWGQFGPPYDFNVQPAAVTLSSNGDKVAPGDTYTFKVYPINAIPFPPANLGKFYKRFSYSTNDPLHPFVFVNVRANIIP
jgi:hypothetical protein